MFLQIKQKSYKNLSNKRKKKELKLISLIILIIIFFVNAMQEAHSKYSFMAVPKVFYELTTKRVLTMEWMVGENPTELISITKELPANSANRYLDERKQLEAQTRLLDLVFVGLNLYKLGKPIETPMMYSVWKF